MKYNLLFYSSSAFAITSLLTSIIIPFFGKRPVHKTWAFFNFLVALWGFYLASLCVVGDDYVKAKYIWDLANVAGVMIPPFFYLFVVLFCEYKPRLFMTFALVQAVIFIVLTLFGAIDLSLTYSKNAFYYARVLKLPYHIEVICWLTIVTYSHWIFYRFLKTAQGDRKIEARYLFVGMFIGFFSGGAAHWLFAYGFPMHPAWNALVTIYTLLISYGIFRYKLLGIDVVIRRGLAYTILISLVTAFYFVFAIFLERVFQRSIGYQPTYSVGALISVTLLGEPLRRWVQSKIDKIFYRGNIDKLHSENMMFEKEILKQDRLKSISTLAAGMAHEIKNPLTSIRTFAEFLPTKYDKPEFREKFSRLVIDEVDRINSIVQQLLDFSKPKDLEMHSVELGALLLETLDLLNNNLLKSNIAVEKSIADEFWVSADRRQLRQVFVNLLLNAIQAMPGGGILRISALKTDSGTEINIEDTGAGIPKEHLSHVFDPFFTTKESGSGLGLAVVHGIVTRHGGKIKAENTAGGGARISVVLKN